MYEQKAILNIFYYKKLDPYSLFQAIKRNHVTLSATTHGRDHSPELPEPIIRICYSTIHSIINPQNLPIQLITGMDKPASITAFST